jgi:hypothetical protein
MLSSDPAGKNRFGVGCAALFALPFIAIGLTTLVAALRQYAGGAPAGNGSPVILALFGLVFAAVGFGVLALVIGGARKSAEADRLRAASPNEPWKWRPDWASGRVRSDAGAGTIFVWAFALIWLAISAPIAWMLRSEVVEKGNHVALVGLLFPLVGIGLLVWAVRRTMALAKFGDPLFEMDAVPGVLGGPLRGRIRLRLRAGPGDRIQLRVSSIRRWTTGSGKNRTTNERVLWSDEREIAPETIVFDGISPAVPVDLLLPFDCDPTDPETADDRKLWRLELDADVPGVDASAQFEIPVFRTRESRPELTQASLDTPPPERIDEPPSALASSRIRIFPAEEGGTEIRFPMARNLGAAFGLSLFCMVWWGVTAALIRFGAPILFPIIFGAISLLLLLGFVESWFRWYRIVLQPGRLVSESALLGVVRVRDLAVARIRQIETRSGMQQGGAAGTKVWYDLVLHTDEGRKIVLASGIGDKRLAFWLASRIRREVGLAGKP